MVRLQKLAATSPALRGLNQKHLVPRRGRIDRFWYVPAGSTQPEVVIAWSHPVRHVGHGLPNRRYGLTVWRPIARHAGWAAHTLFTHSPFPLQSTSVRLAEVTGDGHKDLLVTIECNLCNHAASTASVYADAGARIARIYGRGSYDFLGSSKNDPLDVPGRPITETAWGARKGMVWFDEPHYGPRSSMCCPDSRIQTFLRWDGAHWRTAEQRKLSPERDNYLGQRPVPAP